MILWLCKKIGRGLRTLANCFASIAAAFRKKITPSSSRGSQEDSKREESPSTTARFLRETSTTIFTEVSELDEVNTLLEAVIYADYEKAAEIVRKDPGLIFINVFYEDRDGTVTVMSPLKYAFRVYDTYMWQMFYEKIKTLSQGHIDEFFRQGEEQAHIELECLFKAYETRTENWIHSMTDQEYMVFNMDLEDDDDLENDSGEDKNSHENGLDDCFKQFIRMQKSLPIHMWKELFREGDSWSLHTNFNVTTRSPPPFNRALSEVIGDFKKCIFLFLRGSKQRKAIGITSWDPRVGQKIQEDADILRRLFKTRKKEFDSFFRVQKEASPRSELRSIASYGSLPRSR